MCNLPIAVSGQRKEPIRRCQNTPSSGSAALRFPRVPSSEIQGEDQSGCVSVSSSSPRPSMPLKLMPPRLAFSEARSDQLSRRCSWIAAGRNCCRRMLDRQDHVIGCLVPQGTEQMLLKSTPSSEAIFVLGRATSVCYASASHRVQVWAVPGLPPACVQSHIPCW